MKTKRILLLTALCLALTGCGHEHTWEEATCTEPKTCSECGETEGEALDHKWKDATCEDPKTCKRCGETKGKANGHSWEDATCSSPKTCSECGETEGEALEHEIATEATYQSGAICANCGEEISEPLTADFEAYGIPGSFVTIGETNDYHTCGYDDDTVEVIADATVLSYERDKNLDGLESEDGYEWAKVEWEIYYYDENAWNYGFRSGTSFDNYYDIEYHDDYSYHGEDGYNTYYVMIDGEEYECTEFSVWDNPGWDADTQTSTLSYTIYVYMPEGYDGFVSGLYNRSNTWEEGMYIYDIADKNSLFFRLD